MYDECYLCFEVIGKKFLYLGLFCIYFYKCFNVSDICFKEIKSCFFFVCWIGVDIGVVIRMKLIVNMVMGIVVVGLVEVMVMVEKVGLD